MADRPGILAKVAQAVADAGGNIIAATTWHGRDNNLGYITIKERGANFAQLQRALVSLGVEVADVREKPDYPPQQYG
jgi:glycine cleavage system regulatory protein